MPQTTRASKWEVGLDMSLGTTVNVGFQALFLRTFTFRHGVSFAVIFVLLAILRRYWVRRGFNRLVQSEETQPLWMSLIEVVTDTIIAIAVAFGLLLLWYPAESLTRISSLVGVSYVSTPLGRLILRRLFEKGPKAVAS